MYAKLLRERQDPVGVFAYDVTEAGETKNPVNIMRVFYVGGVYDALFVSSSPRP